MNVGELQAYLRLNNSQFTRGLTQSQGKLRGFGGASGAIFKTIARVAAVAMGAVTAAIGKSIYDAVKFEKALANVSTMVQKNVGPTMEGFRKELLRVSREFGESTDTLAKGLYDILSASIPASKAMTVLEVSTMAAKAGMTETAVAADAVTTMINAFGMSADDAGYAADILFATVVRGKTTFAELAPTIGGVATIAAESGASMKELGAMMALMTRRGIESRKAATFLRSALTQLLKPSDEAMETAKSLGIEFGAQALAAKGLNGVLNDIKGLPPDVLVKLFPNVRALQAVITTTEGMNDEIDVFNDLMSEGSPTLIAFNKNTDTAAHRLGIFKQTIKTTSIEIGEKFLKAFDDTMSKITMWLQGEAGERLLGFFGKLAESIADFIPKLFDFAAKARKFMQWFADILTPVWDAWKEYFALLWGGLKDAIDSIFGFAGDSEKAFDTVQNVLKGLAGAFLINMKVTTFAVTAIIDTIKNLVEIVKDAGGVIKSVFEGKWKEAGEKAKEVWGGIKAIGTDIKEDWQDTIGTIPESLDKVFGKTNMTFNELKNTLSSLGPTAQKMSKTVVESFEYGSEGSKDHTDDVKTDSGERIKARQEESEALRLMSDEELEVFRANLERQKENTAALARAKVEYELWRRQQEDKIKADEEKADDARRKREKEKEKEKVDYIKELSKSLYTELTGIIDQYFSNQISWIDYNLAVEKNALKEQLGDTEEYEEAVKKLEKEAAEEKYRIEIKQFKVRKAESLINTVISTAGAIMKAFEQLGPIGGAIASIFIGGLGIAKAAIISSQAPPPPPTFIRGGEVQAGVLQGRSGVDQNIIAATAGEYIMPPGQTAANINELESMRRGDRSGITITPGPVIVSLDGNEIARATIPYLEKEYDKGRARVNPKAVRTS